MQTGICVSVTPGATSHEHICVDYYILSLPLPVVTWQGLELRYHGVLIPALRTTVKTEASV